MTASGHGRAPVAPAAVASGRPPSETDRGFSTSTWDVLRATLADYRAGEGARARARLGFSTPPQAKRRVWVRAGGSPFDLRLACEVLSVLRERRKDMQLVLTFERDDRAVFKRFLAPDRKLALGWGPADWAPATRRFVRRFEPIGVVAVGTAAHSRNLAGLRVPVAVLDGVDAVVSYAAWRARTARNVAADASCGAASGSALAGDLFWSVTGGAFAATPAPGETPGPLGCDGWRAADPRARFSEAQADTTLAAILGDAQRPTYLVLAPASQADAVARAFRGHALALDSTMMIAVLPEPTNGSSGRRSGTLSEPSVASFARWVSRARPDGLTPLQPPPVAVAPGDARASRWSRCALTPGAILWIDATEWLAAAATAAQAVAWPSPHDAASASALDGALWPVLAAGRACWQVSADASGAKPATQASARYGWVGLRALDAARAAGDALGSASDWPTLFDRWAAALEAGQSVGFAWRRAGDSLRQAFWAARRAVDQDFSELQAWVWRL